jgi:hypothetical protein
MGTVIYSASPWQAFSGSLIAVALLLIIGVVSIGAAVLRRNEGKGSRVFMIVAGVLLVAGAAVLAAFTLVSIQSGTQTVAVRLNDKRIVSENCGQNGESTCNRFVLETSAGAVPYDFDVASDAYNLAQVNTCYRITYYASGGLFSSAATDPNAYHRIDAIARIEVAGDTDCP